eukprot:SAG11_NODE_31327_length_292_cov_7.145078_1_plen_38_part_01
MHLGCTTPSGLPWEGFVVREPVHWVLHTGTVLFFFVPD